MFLKNCFALLLLFFSVHARAQQNLPDTAQLFQDIRVLSADSMAGRKSGTEGSRKAQRYLEQRFKQIGLTAYNKTYKQHVRLQKEKLVVEDAINLIGYIPGQTQEVLVVTAHYDHLGQRQASIFNGADDNASGVGAMLAIAAYFKKHQPYYTLLFVALDGEELGLQGANAFLNAPPVPLHNIMLNVNLDMLSINSKGELYASGSYHYPWLLPYLQQVKALPHAAIRVGHDRPEQGPQDWTNQSDHYQFHKRELPFIYFGVEDHTHYHQTTDTFENINRPFYADATALVLDFIQIVDQQHRPKPNQQK
ncbi:M28 family peptidase [Pontibacter qinzhouensis]|uniref:M28 family peptidase n=1 Tax=Pontibacter qinzhouensis TaxID=2603253 RepID=A0A5C8KF22_9BACT|nr:M28 family peptidase [Pontibacter qinzhouensis]TXK52422.1 M28 family peptidase [Pontibacter qinzhouensis]